VSLTVFRSERVDAFAFAASAGSRNATARTGGPEPTRARRASRTVGANRERTRPRGAAETRDARGVTRGITRDDIIAEVEGVDVNVTLAFADRRPPRPRAPPLCDLVVSACPGVENSWRSPCLQC
jgi:hypothetical protein